METIEENTLELEETIITDDELKKIAKIEEERKTLLSNVLSGNIKSTRERVAYILNRFTTTRNSDIELAWDYWTTFESKKFGGTSVSKSQLYALTRITTLSRERAKIQNEYKLFQADDRVKKYRGVLEEEKKNAAIEDKPANLPIYSVYIDETGKTQEYLSVGSLWIIDGGISTIQTSKALKEWKEKNEINYEFHFAEVRKHKVQSFKDFFIKFLSLNATIGFKIIVVKNTGFKDTNRPITDLTFHILNKGIEHENESKRAPLPRILQVWLDEEEKGSDRIKLENLRERFQSQKIDGLYLGNFDAIASNNNFYIQAVDLFTAAFNRKIHNPESNGHFKDDLATFILDAVNFNFREVDKENTDVDNSTIFNLSDFTG